MGKIKKVLIGLGVVVLLNIVAIPVMFYVSQLVQTRRAKSSLNYVVMQQQLRSAITAQMEADIQTKLQNHPAAFESVKRFAAEAATVLTQASGLLTNKNLRVGSFNGSCDALISVPQEQDKVISYNFSVDLQSIMLVDLRANHRLEFMVEFYENKNLKFIETLKPNRETLGFKSDGAFHFHTIENQNHAELSVLVDSSGKLRTKGYPQLVK